MEAGLNAKQHSVSTSEDNLAARKLTQQKSMIDTCLLYVPPSARCEKTHPVEAAT